MAIIAFAVVSSSAVHFHNNTHTHVYFGFLVSLYLYYGISARHMQYLL